VEQGIPEGLKAGACQSQNVGAKRSDPPNAIYKPYLWLARRIYKHERPEEKSLGQGERCGSI